MRILAVTESSFLSSGYGIYFMELLSRLHRDGFDVAELAGYLNHGDVRQYSVPWKVYSTGPAPGEEAEYHADPHNVFGGFQFEKTVLDFRPDVVLCARDPWMDRFVFDSPLRRFYRLVALASVDSRPQRTDWLEMYTRADAVFTYTEWGQKVLDEEGGGRIPTAGPAPAGAESCFQPVTDRRAHKGRLGLPADSIIFGMASRLQPRKLFHDLYYAFATYLKEAPFTLARKSFLYCHTSFPDIGGDIPTHIRDAGVMSRVYFTYICHECGHCYPSLFQDARTVCRKCGHWSAYFPNTQKGVSRDELAVIYNAFDVSIQWASCEGQGLTLGEAAACGVPTIAMDYSAMEDTVRHTRGIPVKPAGMFCQADLGMWRAFSDESGLVKSMMQYARMPEEVRRAQGYRAAIGSREHFDYERTAQRWRSVINRLEPVNQWHLPPSLVAEDTAIPKEVLEQWPNGEFVAWGLTHIAGRPDLVDSLLAARMTKNLDWGSSDAPIGSFGCPEMSVISGSSRTSTYHRDNAIAEWRHMARHRNKWEKRRVGLS